jgi:hypothetical protein
MIFVATKNGKAKKKFPPPLLVLLLDPGSEIRDWGGIKIRIRKKQPGSATLVMRNKKDFSRSELFHLNLVPRYKYSVVKIIFWKF